MSDLKEQLIDIVQNEPWLMALLRAARSERLPDWYIAAGAIRNTVWDVLHDRALRTPLHDVDLIYFDPSTTDYRRDIEIWERLQKLDLGVTWNVFNQSRAHLKYPERYPVLTSAGEAIAYWSETATCVGVRLEDDETLTVHAPHGLDDLFALCLRPVPEPYRDLDLFDRRLKEKGWVAKWPKLVVERR